MQNELQAAFEVSSLTTDRQPDAEKIAALIGAGRCVVVARYPMYCRFTDAYIDEEPATAQTSSAATTQSTLPGF